MVGLAIKLKSDILIRKWTDLLVSLGQRGGKVRVNTEQMFLLVKQSFWTDIGLTVNMSHRSWVFQQLGL
jgi:hypothetical protein